MWSLNAPQECCGEHQFRDVVGIFNEIYPRWKVLLAEEQGKEDRVYDTGEGA